LKKKQSDLMGLEDLNESEILQGSFSLIFVIISVIIGLIIFTKYFSLKRKEYITIGLTWIFMSTVWWSASISFITILFFNFALNPFWYLFIGNIMVAAALWCWIYSFCILANPTSKIIIISIYSAICVIYEVFLIVFFIVDPSVIGSLEGKFYYQPKLWTMFFQIFAVFTTLVTGILFSKESMKVNDPLIKLKGKFLLVAFISFTIGALLDALLAFTPLNLVIVRLILISSAIEYYFGFFVPKRLANWIIQ
jgi:hypothetical protein